jgi:hypothetical protein
MPSAGRPAAGVTVVQDEAPDRISRPWAAMKASRCFSGSPGLKALRGQWYLSVSRSPVLNGFKADRVQVGEHDTIPLARVPAVSVVVHASRERGAEPSAAMMAGRWP